MYSFVVRFRFFFVSDESDVKRDVYVERANGDTETKVTKLQVNHISEEITIGPLKFQVRKRLFLETYLFEILAICFIEDEFNGKILLKTGKFVRMDICYYFTQNLK